LLVCQHFFAPPARFERATYG